MSQNTISEEIIRSVEIFDNLAEKLDEKTCLEMDEQKGNKIWKFINKNGVSSLSICKSEKFFEYIGKWLVQTESVENLRTILFTVRAHKSFNGNVCPPETFQRYKNYGYNFEKFFSNEVEPCVKIWVSRLNVKDIVLGLEKEDIDLFPLVFPPEPKAKPPPKSARPIDSVAPANVRLINKQNRIEQRERRAKAHEDVIRRQRELRLARNPPKAPQIPELQKTGIGMRMNNNSKPKSVGQNMVRSMEQLRAYRI